MMMIFPVMCKECQTIAAFGPNPIFQPFTESPLQCYPPSDGRCIESMKMYWTWQNEYLSMHFAAQAA